MNKPKLLGYSCTLLHASRNVVQHLKCLEIVQAIEHSVVVNACKNSTIDHKLQRCLSGGVQNSHTFSMGHHRSFTPALLCDVIMKVGH